MRKAKIVSTIGPASDSPEMLDRLIGHGMDAARQWITACGGTQPITAKIERAAAIDSLAASWRLQMG